MNIRSLYLSSEQLRGFTLLSPTLAIMVLFLALPLGIILIYSLWTKGGGGLEPSFVFASYENFFNHKIPITPEDVLQVLGSADT